MIEEVILEALETGTNVNAYMEIPEEQEESFVVLERTGGGQRGAQMRTAVFAVQSYAPTLLAAATLNEKVLNAMQELQYQENEITTCQLNSTYNFTDPETRRYRYQAVFDLVYFIEEG